MTAWTVICNPNDYNLEKAFSNLTKIDWKQTINAEVGDIVYMYVASPIKAIRYKCRINKVNLSYVEIDDTDYAQDDTKYGDYGRYMELELISKCNSKKLAWDELSKHGLTHVRGSVRITGELGEFINSAFESTGKGENEEYTLLDEKPQLLLENQITIFKQRIKEYKTVYDELEMLRNNFVSYYTMKRLMDMKKEDYVIGLERHNTFCYKIENELKRLGDIHGANSMKFGLYYGTLGDDKEEKYHLAPKFGNDLEKGFEEIKREIIYLRMAGESEDYDKIRDCKLWPLFRGKILATFFPEKYLAIFSKEHLVYFLAKLGIQDVSDDVLEMQIRLLDWKKRQKQLNDIDNHLFMKFLYDSFGHPFNNESTTQDAQDQRDKEYPREYVSKIGISVPQWKSLLKDSEVFSEKDIGLIKRFYLCDNHAAACYDFGIQDGVNPSSFIKPIVDLAKRIKKKMSLPPTIGSDGSEVWWRIPFWGKYREDGHFEWKVRPKLAKALAQVYPELEMDEINLEEDEKLVTELKQARLTNTKEDFQYIGKPKDKPAAIYVSGHKTYPRDRQIAINALAHAHYCCEIDMGHQTFIRRNSDKPYTEPHHLIPMASSDEFAVSLDIEENIVSLCSNCHNQIHYGQDAEVLLKKLYDERKGPLETAGIKLSFDRLLAMYNIHG